MVSKLRLQFLSVISHNGKAAAFGWALRTKRAHDDVSIGLERIFYRRDITFSLLGFDQKVENSPIMPNIVETRW